MTMDNLGVTEQLARARTPDSPSGWLWVGAVAVLYLLVRFLLAYAANRRAGVDRPAHRVWSDLRDRPPRDRRQGALARFLAGRAVILVGMLVLLPVAFIPAKGIRVAILAVAVPLVIAAVAYTDHRTSSRRAHRESGQQV